MRNLNSAFSTFDLILFHFISFYLISSYVILFETIWFFVISSLGCSSFSFYELYHIITIFIALYRLNYIKAVSFSHDQLMFKMWSALNGYGQRVMAHKEKMTINCCSMSCISWMPIVYCKQSHYITSRHVTSHYVF